MDSIKAELIVGNVVAIETTIGKPGEVYTGEIFAFEENTGVVILRKLPLYYLAYIHFYLYTLSCAWK